MEGRKPAGIDLRTGLLESLGSMVQLAEHSPSMHGIFDLIPNIIGKKKELKNRFLTQYKYGTLPASFSTNRARGQQLVEIIHP